MSHKSIGPLSSQLRITALLFLALLALPYCANAQYGGVAAGWLHAANNRIAQFGSSRGSAEFLQPGYYVGGYYAAKDSGTCFRLDLGWERQTWRQGFGGERVGGSPNITRSGTRTSRMDLLRAAPQVAFAPGHKTRILLGAEFGVLLHARNTEVATTLGYQYPMKSDSTYSGVDGYNGYQLALRFGVEQVVYGGWSLGFNVGVGRSVFVQDSRKRGDDLIPVTVRLYVARSLGRRRPKES